MAFLLIQSAICCAQNTVTIRGEVPGAKRSSELTLFMANGDSVSFIQETSVKDDRFTFEFTPPADVELPMKLAIFGSDKSSKSPLFFWVPAGTTLISGSGNDVLLWSVENDSREQADHKMLNRVKNDFRQELEKTYAGIAANQRKIASSAVNEDVKEFARLAVDSLSEAYNDTYRKIRMAQLNYLSSNAGISKAGAPVLEEIVSSGLVHGNYMEPYRDMITKLYEGMSPELKNSSTGLSIKSMMEPPKIVQIGDTIPDITLSALKGTKHKFSDFRGKYMLINLWVDEWSCIDAFPELRQVKKNYDKQLTVVGIYLGTDREVWKDLTARYGLQWVNLSDGKGPGRGVASRFNIEAVPMFVLVDANGRVVDIWVEFAPGSITESIKFLGR